MKNYKKVNKNNKNWLDNKKNNSSIPDECWNCEFAIKDLKGNNDRAICMARTCPYGLDDPESDYYKNMKFEQENE